MRRDILNLNGTLQTGVVLVLFPSQSLAGAVVERSGSTGWEVVGTLDDVADGGSPFFDYLPLDGQSRFYRAKHREPGYVDGGYSDTVEAVPQPIPLIHWEARPWLMANVIPLQLVMTPFSETSSSIHVTASVNSDPANFGQTPTVSVLNYFNVPAPTPTGSNGWVINKPSSGFGRVVFQNTLPGRISDSDAIDITTADVSGSSQWLVLNLNVSASSADTVGVSASVANPFAVPALVSVASSGNISSLTNDGTNRWTIGRPTTGEGYVTFYVTSSTSNVISDYDTFYISKEPNPYLNAAVSVTNVGTDGVGLTASLVVRDSNITSGTLTGITITSSSQGLSGLSSLIYSTSNTGGTITNVYHITRPNYGQGTGRLSWEATKTGYTRDTDSVEVPERVTGLANLSTVAKITSMNSTAVSMSVTVTDSVPSAGNYIYLSVTSTGVGTILPTGPFTIASGDTKTFVAARPQGTNGAGEVRFLATASARVSDLDIVVISEATSSVPSATITIGTPVASSTGITYPYTFPAGSTAAKVAVWSQEWTLQPSSSNVEFVGTVAVGSPLYQDDGRSSIFIPVATGGNWLLTSFIPYDWNGVRGFVSNSVAQSATTGTPPTLFTSAVNFSLASTSVTNRLTMPASNLPSTIRVYRDGVQFGSDIAVTAGANATQDLTHSGLTSSTTYGWTYEGISSGGTPTTSKTTVLYTTTTGGGTIPTPSIAFTGFQDIDGGTIWFQIVPGAGTPAGTTWTGEYSVDDTVFDVSIPTQTSTYFGITGIGNSPYTFGYCHMRGWKHGYTTSADSNDAKWWNAEFEQ